MLLTEDGSSQQEHCCNFSKTYRAVIKTEKGNHTLLKKKPVEAKLQNI